MALGSRQLIRVWIPGSGILGVQASKPSRSEPKNLIQTLPSAQHALKTENNHYQQIATPCNHVTTPSDDASESGVAAKMVPAWAERGPGAPGPDWDAQGTLVLQAGRGAEPGTTARAHGQRTPTFPKSEKKTEEPSEVRRREKGSTWAERDGFCGRFGALGGSGTHTAARPTYHAAPETQTLRNPKNRG